MRMLRHTPDRLADNLADKHKRILVPFTWIEHVASPLPRECSTTELKGLPYYLHMPLRSMHKPNLERVKGIEPSS